MGADAGEKMVFDFRRHRDTDDWRAIDDRIMGGCSKSQPEHIKDIGMRFSGNVSLENNGGFASIRSASACHNLGGFQGLKIRFRGDGKTYKISLRTDNYFDGISYQAEFVTNAGTWQELVLPFDQFKPTHHGVRLTTVAPMNSSQIKSFGLFIAGRQSGTFQLDVAWIKAVCIP